MSSSLRSQSAEGAFLLTLFGDHAGLMIDGCTILSLNVGESADKTFRSSPGSVISASFAPILYPPDFYDLPLSEQSLVTSSSLNAKKRRSI
jgi:hypothetical protein